jgi:hypothetical protein
MSETSVKTKVVLIICGMVMLSSLGLNVYQFAVLPHHEIPDQRVQQKALVAATEAFKSYYKATYNSNANDADFIITINYEGSDDTWLVRFRTKPLPGGTLHTTFAFRVVNNLLAKFSYFESSGSY